MNPIRSFARSTKFQTALIMTAALLIGAGTYLYLISFQTRVTQERELVPVYVARSEIASGTTFADIRAGSLLEIRELPAGSIPSDALQPESTIDTSLRTRGVLTAGQLIVASHFTAEGMPEMTLPIPPGKLAVTISVDDVGRVGNFVLPGSRVAIFAAENASVRVLISEVLVIAVGDQTQTPSGTSTLSSPYVTLALTPKDAERVIGASSDARLTLALAHANDPSSVLGAPVVQESRG